MNGFPRLNGTHKTPAPMPALRVARAPLQDAYNAIQRSLAAWRVPQALSDIEAAERFLQEAKAHLTRDVNDTSIETEE